MENSQLSGSNGCRCLSCIDASSGCLTPDQAHSFIFYKMIKSSDGIGTAAHTGQNRIRQTAFLFQHLFLDFL